MSFCKKGLHSFLSFTYLSDTNSPSPPSPPLHKCYPGSLGIGLVTATGDTRRPPNVLESATVGPPPPRLPTPFHSVFADVSDALRKASDVIVTVGFFEEVGEVVDGLMSCTESLGFESSDERRVDEGVRDLGNDGGDSDLRLCLLSRAKRREESERMRERKFPPPITSLNDKGRPSFFLRPLRRDGRLELSEVRIDRPEILRASRADGRLRLEFVKDSDELEENAEEVEIEIEEDEEEAEDTTLEEDVRGEEWKVPISGEGFGRCHDVVGHGHGHGDCHPHHHHHNMHVWRQHCVTIR